MAVEMLERVRQRVQGDGQSGDGAGELLVGHRRGKEDMGMALEIAPGVAYLRTFMVNLFFLGERGAGDRGWVLVDAGRAIAGGCSSTAASWAARR
jgi:hypothetical protein